MKVLKRIAYINADCYVDTDFTVLRHLARQFEVVWYPVYYTDRPIYYTPEQMLSYARENGIEIHLCPRQYRQRDPRNYAFYSKIVEDINNREVDIVYSCTCEELYWTLASWKLKAQRVLGLHDVVMHHFGAPVKRLIQTGIRELTILGSRNVCVFSGNQAALFNKRYGRVAEILGLSCRRLGPVTVDTPSISQGVRMLFFGNIVEYKGLDLLIACMEKLRSQGITNLFLTVAGRGEHWGECEKQIKTRQMYDLNIRFIDNEEIPNLLASHHFMALPYRNATQSGPMSLAAGYGMPILAPEYGCFKEYYDRQSGVLYSDLESALRQLASMSQEEYDQMGQNAALLKDKFSEEAIAQRYIQYFNSL
jgi:glycosyltransferase involved in cell wall biosynthesis